MTARNTSSSLGVVSSDGAGVDLDLLAASLRADSSDLSAFVESMAAKLEEAVPGRVRVDRRRAGMFGPKTVRGFSVDLGDRRLELRADGGAVRTRCARLSTAPRIESQRLCQWRERWSKEGRPSCRCRT